jgi:tetratricopeptide (TPR) repeat protein
MKSLHSLLLCLLVSFASWSPMPGQGSVSSPELAPAIALSHRVEQLKKAFTSGDATAIKSAIEDVEVFRRTFGTHDVTPLVEAMALWARSQGDSGNPSRGLEVVNALERWAPGHPIILGSRVVLYRQTGPRGYLDSLPDVLQLTKLRLTHPTHRWLWIVQHVAWIRLMASILLWGWAVSLVLRYRNVFRYLWEDPLSKRGMSSILMAITGAVMLALPLLAGLDPGLAAMFWLWLLAPFMIGSEIKATLFVILLQLVHPALALLEPEAAKIPAPSVVTLQVQPQSRGLDELGVSKLPAEDREFIKGWQQLAAQNWAAAEATFSALATSHPDRAEVLNNLGVARFQQGKLEQAKMDFDMAAGEAARSVASRRIPEIPLNQSVVAFKQLDSTLGISKQEEARLLDPEYVKGLMTANQSRTDQRTFAVALADTPSRVAALESGSKGMASSWVERLLSVDILFWVIATTVAVSAFLFRLKQSLKQVHPTQCTRCGEPFHTTDCPDVNVCSKCHHLFVLKDGLHGESRKRKVEEVGTFQRTQRWIHRILIVLAPGLDLGFLGETRQGLLEFSFLAFAFGIVFATGRTVRFPGEIIADPASSWQALGLVLLAVLFLRSWLKLLPRRTSGMR